MMTVVHASLPPLATMCALRASARSWLPSATIPRLQINSSPKFQHSSNAITADLNERGAKAIIAQHARQTKLFDPKV